MYCDNVEHVIIIFECIVIWVILLVEKLWDIILIMCSSCFIICIICQCTVFLGSRAYRYYKCLTFLQEFKFASLIDDYISS